MDWTNAAIAVGTILLVLLPVLGAILRSTHSIAADNRETKVTILGLKDDVQELKTDMKDVKTEITIHGKDIAGIQAVLKDRERASNWRY